MAKGRRTIGAGFDGVENRRQEPAVYFQVDIQEPDDAALGQQEALGDAAAAADVLFVIDRAAVRVERASRWGRSRPSLEANLVDGHAGAAFGVQDLGAWVG